MVSFLSTRSVCKIFLFSLIATCVEFLNLSLIPVRSPPFLRHTKHSAQGEDDAIFSYVVIKRGSRPGSLPVAAELLGEEEEIEESDASILLEKGEAKSDNELAWSRIIAPPRKRSGHVLLDVCASSGMSPSSPPISASDPFNPHRCTRATHHPQIPRSTRILRCSQSSLGGFLPAPAEERSKSDGNLDGRTTEIRRETG